MSEFTNIQREIHKTIENYKGLKVAESHLDEIDTQLSNALRSLNQLDQVAQRELKEWEDLEKLGVKSAFYKILGSKEQQIEKERQDYLDASLKYNEHQKMVELMEFEKDIIQKKVAQLPQIETKLAQLKKARESEILNSDDFSDKNELTRIAQELDNASMLEKEVKEAILAGRNALKYLSQIQSFLKSAINWGRWDMTGKGNYSAHMKHSAIEKARQTVHHAQHHLNLFTRELADFSDQDFNFQLHIVNFSRFTDFFFDNLISDWIIQQKIKNSLNNIEANIDQVVRIIKSLESEIISIEQRKNQLELDHENLLLK